MIYSLSPGEITAIRDLIRTILNDRWSDKPLDDADLLRQAEAIDEFLK